MHQYSIETRRKIQKPTTSPTLPKLLRYLNTKTLNKTRGSQLSCEKLFAALKDGAWHNLNELASQLEIPLDKLIECAQDLYSKSIVEYQETAQKIKIQPEWKTLLPDENLATD